MSYASKRPRVTKKQRAFIFARDGGRCYLCGLEIDPDGPWDADHELARELGGSDEIANLRPAHVACHRAKSKSDVKLIAKSNRLRKKHGLDAPSERRKAKIKTRANPWQQGRKIPTKPMRNA